MVTKMTKAFELKSFLMTAAVGALMLPSLGWSAADGRGHNGPNLSPISIPMQLDRGIRVDHLSEAISVCFAKGDSKQGIVSLTQRLMAQLAGVTIENITREFAFSNSFATEDVKEKTFLPVVNVWSQRSTDDKYYFIAGKDYRLVPGVFAFAFVPGFIRPLFNDGWQVNLRMPVEFPKVKYTSIVQDTGYDDYGRVDGLFRIVRGISIETDAESYGTSVTLYNAETFHKTAVTVNTVEYVECLKSELQKRAE